MGEEKESGESKKKSMCKVGKEGDLERIRRRVRDSKYFCAKCGRAAHSKVYLCKPTAI
ncbi:MAG TPA: hypothetical protein VN260_04890 [Dissulfurispiraceae bacterium]|nr:hypothetical protein [Dissulfurispiraceae bacterium]